MLSKLLNEFKDITVKLNDLLENNNIEFLEELMDKRQSIIDELNSLSYSKDDFGKIVSDIDLVVEEERLGQLLKTRLRDTKIEIENNKTEMTKLRNKRTANKMYGHVNANPLDPVFLSRKY